MRTVKFSAIFLILGIAPHIFCGSPIWCEEDKGEKTLLAGAAKTNITPPLGTSLAGYMRDRAATHVHDDLFARSLVIDNGETRVAFVICDSLAIYGKDIDKAKQLIREHSGIPPENVLIAATHSHTAPTVVSVFQSEPDEEYASWLVTRMADSVRIAVNNLRPAKIGWGMGSEESEVFNRRFFMKPGTTPPNPWGETDEAVKMNPGHENPNIVKPAGPIDPDVAILAVRNEEGDPIAVLGNYTLHYVGGGSGSDVSADYFGVWAEIMERELGGNMASTKPPFVAMLTNGCSGDINNIDVHNRLEQPHRYHQMHAVARKVADEAVRVVGSIDYRDWVPLAAEERILDFGVRKPSQEEIDEAKEIWNKAERPLKTLREIYARETVLLAKRADRVQTPVQAIRIGDVGIATFPGEAFVELGLEVKEKAPFPMTFCIELANDYVGYIPTVEAHSQGSYETWRARSSFLERGAAPSMVSTALNLLQNLRSTHSKN